MKFSIVLVKAMKTRGHQNIGKHIVIIIIMADSQLGVHTSLQISRPTLNKPKMAYSRDLPKMERWMTGMDNWHG